jgi:hypothetical protein
VFLILLLLPTILILLPVKVFHGNVHNKLRGNKMKPSENKKGFQLKNAIKKIYGKKNDKKDQELSF